MDERLNGNIAVNKKPKMPATAGEGEEDMTHKEIPDMGDRLIHKRLKELTADSPVSAVDIFCGAGGRRRTGWLRQG